MSDSIKIVVRVRPFNQNELGQSNVVEMDDQQVRLKNPEDGQIKKFGFHRCYWSTDGSRGAPPVNNMFVFNDIGKEILQHIYQGYNSTVFAYGQTGSGKSYSIEGYEQKGLLQLCLEDIFMRRKVENTQNNIATSVRVSYLEIYNEKLRDLLNPNGDVEIKVQSTGTAIFIQGVEPVLCESYEEVEKLFKDGKKIRVIGAHAMNKTSSRSHAVFTIYYKEAGGGKMIQAKFNIVDLAGSERQSKTGATGVRLQEANNINKSLTNLGIVIEALAKNCSKKQSNFVPYRNSLLTHVLSESLCGNSKTFMIAAVSPAQSNYEETLSTLRFAQRASMITTQTKKNVQQSGAYNKELMEEIERLKQELAKANPKEIHTHSHSVNVEYITIDDRTRQEELEARIKQMIQELENNKLTMGDLEKQLEDERKRKLQMENNRNKALKQAGLSMGTETEEQNKNRPYIMNISEDPTLAGMLIYHLKEGETNIGTNEAEENQIKLNALGIMKRHCSIVNTKDGIWIEPKPECKLFVNGSTVTQRRKLAHLDRITMGHANTFKLVIPGQQMVNLLAQSMGLGGKYGEFLDDRLNNNTEEAKNLKIFLQELEHRLDKASFSKFLDKYRSYCQDVDEANQYTALRYKKYPLSSRNLKFRIKVIIDIDNYLKATPELIVVCEHRETQAVQFIWSEDKFQTRLADMQAWYTGGDKENTASGSSVQFDPWFDASDQFIKEKELIETLSDKQIYEFWVKKSEANAQENRELRTQQTDILAKLKQFGANDDVVEDYADMYLRGLDLPQGRVGKVEKLKGNPQVHTLVKRFMEVCAEVQKCAFNFAFYKKAVDKYAAQREQAGNQGHKDGKSGTAIDNKLTTGTGFKKAPNTNQDLVEENAWLSQRMEMLQYEIKRLTKELKSK